MKIAIPTANGALCMHFGHCEVFSIFDVNPDTREIISREYLTPPPHEPGVLPAWLGEQNVDLIIAGGMGQHAQQIFTAQNIDVVVGVPTATLEEIVKNYLAGTLASGTNACDH